MFVEGNRAKKARGAPWDDGDKGKQASGDCG